MSTSSSQHRINDLTLKVTSPSGTVYYGNNGLDAGNVSTPGGSPNTIDNVENVFIDTPEQGIWTIEVSADEVNADGHVETPEMDVDYALVISGGDACALPSFVAEPADVCGEVGGTVVLTALASGGTEPTYEWRKGAMESCH